ncbi:peptide/nickel transport system substrate-binding protein [Rhizobium wenxiniae]|uniref:Peptide/nickel transport system substrate-binding protein n=1 Tax=Rhizobium wenxiniae TaxID=1737357 RepID=A0A7X0D2L9_9HYPH|nr:ABC transporter substrate-binding protein [Rhizobium wenxiniae]MBB6165745.1 peptide/nickel transport system substrate-binding protein [Rhizobium wenxiniae]
MANIKRRKLIAVTAAMGLLALLPLAAAAKTPENQLVVGFSMANVLTLDPAGAGGKERVQIITNLYDNLVGIDPSDRTSLMPELAERWVISEDGNSIRLTLRTGAVFASGNPVTSEDVVWSFKRVLALNLAQATNFKIRGYTAQNADENFVAVDAQTVEIRIPQKTDPNIILLTLAMTGPGSILDKKTVLQNEKNGDFGSGWLATHAAGSGAFGLQIMTPNEIVVLKRNENYWGAPATMDRVIMRHLPESQSQRLLLAKGDLDIAYSLSAADLSTMEKDEDIKIINEVGNGLYYLAMSMKDKALSDPRVRQAIIKLIDFEGINNSVMKYYGVAHVDPIQIGLGGEKGVKPPAPDVEEAKSLLAEAGYANGLKLSLHALSEPPFDNLSVAIQGALTTGGIDVNIISGGGETVYGPMRKRDFQLVVGRSGGQVSHPDGDLRSIVHNPDNRDEAQLSGLLSWRVSYKDDELNRAIDEALFLAPDQQKAEYAKIQKLYRDKVPAIQAISQVTDSVAARADISGLVISPVWQTRLSTVGKAR